MTDKSNNIKINRADIITSVSKSVLGAVPFAGSLLCEIVENTIPNQRLERLTAYVKELDEKILKISNENLKDLLENPIFIDLIEESFFQASRALTKERRNYITNIVINGITNDKLQIENSKFLLKIIQELNDIEIIWLRFFLEPTINGDKEFREKQKNILQPIYLYRGADKEEIIKSTIQKNYKLHLERLGLVVNHPKTDSKTGLPVFEKSSGQQQIKYTRITTLGEILLENIGLK
ncbi:hypothetical protein CJ739_2174 [Mariniflexile rhizosphaerae]|uniref:hypothetical protein n=1 Tax=unclassified Mariniflexile TaxID=2643887 RepID=UPI000CB515BA|nr:hypothetical protein [Mariniflexile sp. TRM1-10]AXP81255.1 hypothetical protein CJ739_2174 [Mariniflexile sp. TRM1-10]PLB18131.1 MAG: hypothetical protein TRG1_3050 [Flavobacteriaceae bacterium FS1-H7996/R]